MKLLTAAILAVGGLAWAGLAAAASQPVDVAVGTGAVSARGFNFAVPPSLAVSIAPQVTQPGRALDLSSANVPNAYASQALLAPTAVSPSAEMAGAGVAPNAFSTFAAAPLAAPPQQTPFPPAVPAAETPPPGLMIGTSGTLGGVGGTLSPTTTALLGASVDPNSSQLHAGRLNVASANITQTYDVVNVLPGIIGTPLLSLNALPGVTGTLTGTDQNLTLLGGVTSGNYITGINYGLQGLEAGQQTGPGGILGLLLPNGAPSWAAQCGNVSLIGIPLLTASCWTTNAAQNNQTLIGDGASANGSEEVVVGTGASHTLAPVAADSLFGGNGTAGTTGVPDADYQDRLGHSVVIGDQASGNQNAQTLIGAGASSNQANSIALGYDSFADRGAQTNYTAFGLTAPQTSDGELSVGNDGTTNPLEVNTDANGNPMATPTITRQITNVAAGSEPTDAVNVAQLEGAVGTLAAGEMHYYSVNSTNQAAGSNYANDGATGTNAIAAGVSAQGAGTDSVAVGDKAKAGTQTANGTTTLTDHDTAIGGESFAFGGNATALGSSSSATGAGGAAVGYLANAGADQSVAVGQAATVGEGSTGAVAIGYGSFVVPAATDGLAIGHLALASAASGVALGANAVATDANDVALGAGSVTAAPVAVTGATIGGTAYTFAGAAPNAAVSVGAAAAGTTAAIDRQVQNVAAGQLSATSTDAVNGSQLYATNSAIDALGDRSVQYDLNKDGSVNYGSVTLAGPASTDGGVTGGTTITNVHQGAVTSTSTDAVNGAQLYSVQQTANAGWNITTAATGTGVASGTSVANVGPARRQPSPPATTSSPRRTRQTLPLASVRRWPV